jgi:hypothetical protein
VLAPNARERAIYFSRNSPIAKREEGSIIKSMGGANTDSTNGIKNRILFKSKKFN